MSRAWFVTFVLSILGSSLASRANAKLPDPNQCDVPDHIVLVACGADGSADRLGAFTIQIRNLAGQPQNSYVAFDFSNCPDVRICAAQGDPVMYADCASHAVTAMTDMNGRLTLRIIGCARNSGASPGATAPTLHVYADGVWLKDVRVAALDQNGSGGVSADDLSLFLADYFSGQNFARSDYDGNGVLDGNDMSFWLAAFFAGGSAQSGGPACP
jgi:hypothetical protein